MVLGNQVEGKCSGRNIRLLDIAELTARRAGAQVVWGCGSSNWSVEWVSRFEFGFLPSIVASRETFPSFPFLALFTDRLEPPPPPVKWHTCSYPSAVSPRCRNPTDHTIPALALSVGDLELMFSCNGDACRRALSAALPNRHSGRCRWETGLRRARNGRRDCTRIPPTSPHRSSRRNKRPLNDDPLANGRGQTSQGMGRRNA
jgi:hypothetical protein